MVNKLLQVGITGGIGSGKTLVCRAFQILGIPVYNADDRAKHLMNNDEELISQIIHNFGKDSFTQEQKLNNIFLAREVFQDNKKLELLNSLVHPRVRMDFNLWVDQNSSAPYVIKEAALLVETGSYKQLDQLILVYAPEDVRLERVVMRDSHRSLDQIKAIMEKQMPESEKKLKAHYTIINDNKTLVIPQIITLHDKLLKISQSSTILKSK